MSAPPPPPPPQPPPPAAACSLDALLRAHRTLLVLDAASARVQTGLLDRAGAAHWETGDAEAGAAIFAGVE
ncbi:MAG: hypothetical protein LBC18_00960, partial [Opitutaceae bacterium]|nr:hypothetical protein [Opitutaceae bacterium]